jgi:ribose/xylose/arabinose/galactoside ABC-type transport system permease subunit
MNDSLAQQAIAAAGIPDWGTRVTILVITGVMLGVTALLLYFKMKEADERSGG